MKQFLPLILMVVLILVACQGCASPKYLVNKDDCPEQAGEKYLICKKVEKIK